MTLFELSFRNARRQARDYVVYFVTISLAAALLYAYNGLVFSNEIRTLASSMNSLSLTIVLASVVVVCVFGWLVAYAVRFMLLRRSRELGTYILIGLENRQVARMFFMENLMVGGCALAMGLGLGGLLYQAFRAIIFNLFGLPYHFALGFSLPAVMLTAVYFSLIYLYALRRNRKRIRRMKIYDLIYSDKRNEETVIRSGRKRQWVFMSSIVLGVIGVLLLISGGILFGLAGAACIILFLFGFFLSFASGVPAFFERRPVRKYQGQNLLIFRTLTAKLATMGIVMSVISMIFTATIMVEGSGLVFNGLFRGRAAEQACFDLYFGIEGKQREPQVYLDYIKENISVEQCALYQVYVSGSADVQEYVISRTAYYAYDYDEQDAVLRWSDYAALRAIAGYPAAEQEPGRYLIHCMPYLEEPLRDYTWSLNLGAVSLTPGSVYTEPFFQGTGVTNGRGYILIVPDEAVEGLEVHHLAYAAKTSEPVSAEQFEGLTAAAAVDKERFRSDPTSYLFFTTKANANAEAASQTAITVFPLFFLALALTMTAATILTLQQLSESERYKRQFELLRKLGMDRWEMAGALRKQFAIYYTMPAVPALLIGVPFILKLAGTPEPGVMVGASSPGVIVCITLGIFFLIYGIYIVLAYTGLKRNVLPAEQ